MPCTQHTSRFRSLEHERSRRGMRRQCRGGVTSTRCIALLPKHGLERCGLCTRNMQDRLCHHHRLKVLGPNPTLPTVDRLLVPSTIGNGLEFRLSALSQVGDRYPNKGVYATRYFKKKDLVTFYDGDVFTKNRSTRVENQRMTHWKTVENSDFVIDGVREHIDGVPFMNVTNRGAGSLMNSASGDGANVECMVMSDLSTTMRVSREINPNGPVSMQVPTVFFFARYDIKPGDELFWNYRI